MNRTVVAIIALVVLAGGGWYFFLRDNGGPAEIAGDTGPQAGAPIVSITVPEQLSANATIGKRAFEAKCAKCHAENAVGQEGVAPPLVHKIYEPGHHGDASFFLAVQRGVRSHHWRFGDMPPVEGLTEADVSYIVAYVRELQRANGIN